MRPSGNPYMKDSSQLFNVAPSNRPASGGPRFGRGYSESPSRYRRGSVSHSLSDAPTQSSPSRSRPAAAAPESPRRSESPSILQILEILPSTSPSPLPGQRKKLIIAPVDSSSPPVAPLQHERLSIITPERAGPRHQHSAITHASYIRLSEFRDRKLVFHWPGHTQDNLPTDSLRLGAHEGIPLVYKDFLAGAAGTAMKTFINIYATKSANGFEDTIAVKTIGWKKEDQKTKAFNELDSLKDLSHNHIIVLLGSFIQEKRLGILMFPVASYNLQKFMDMVSQHNDSRLNDPTVPEHDHVRFLRSYFACLCQALIYLHEDRKIKHKDIKPENILVDRFDSVILTDFGISTRHADSANPVTRGPTGCTVRYAAKEAVEEGDRGFDIDIFSLGCVFLEMATVILGETIENLCNAIGKRGAAQDGGIQVTYYDCEEQIKRWFETLKERCAKSNLTLGASPPPLESEQAIPCSNEQLLDMILKMMSNTPAHRPKLLDVWKLFDKVTVPCKECHPTFQSLQPRPMRDAESLPVTTATGVTATVTNKDIPKMKDAGPGDRRGRGNNIPIPTGSSVHDFGYPDKKPAKSPEKAPHSAPGTRKIMHTEDSVDGKLLPPPPRDNPQPPTTPLEHLALPADSNPTIRVFSLGKNPGVKGLRSVDEVRGHNVLVWDEHEDITLVPKRDMNFSDGVLMRMPHGDGWRWKTLKGEINLWKKLSFRLNLKRAFPSGDIRMMFFEGNYPTNMLLGWTDTISSRRVTA